MRTIIVYSKIGCHLCERVMFELEKLRAHENFNLTAQDITEDPELYRRYKNIIPVIAVDGTVKLAGSALSNPKTLRETLERAVFTNLSSKS